MRRCTRSIYFLDGTASDTGFILLMVIQFIRPKFHEIYYLYEVKKK